MLPNLSAARAPALSLALALVAAPASAEAPRVVASIGPIHSLAAQVMEGVGAPTLLVEPGSTPHGVSLKPSQARALSEAQLLFWIGPELERWLERPIDALSADARAIALSDVDGATTLPVREGAAWAAHDHDHDHGHGHDDHGHDDHGHGEKAEAAKAEDHAHDDHAHDDHAHDDHGHGEKAEAPKAEDHAHDEHAHGEGAFDPHLWLDPKNAKVWLSAMAAALSEADPANAERYAQNAAEARAALDALSAEVDAAVAPARGKPYVVLHDAYQYFERRFDIAAAGAIAFGDAEAPGPQRLREIRETVQEGGVVCVFAEPQLDGKLVDTVLEGTSAKRATLDPLGARFEPGPDLYAELIRDLGASLSGCLAN